MLRKVVLGSGMVAFIPKVEAATPIKSEGGGPAKPPPMKASDLPLYDTPHADYVEYISAKKNENKPSVIREALHGPIKATREQVQSLLDQTSVVTNAVKVNYHEFQDRSDWIVKYLREEENKQQRYGAVAMGGLTGFIFGLRGGIIKRLFYAGIGTTAMGAVCFPEETRDIAHENMALARQYINIAYNFAYGVKPGDPQLEVKFPELSYPRDFSQFVDMTASLAATVKQAVMPPPAKEATKPSDKKE